MVPNCLIQKSRHIRGGHHLTRKQAEESKKEKQPPLGNQPDTSSITIKSTSPKTMALEHKSDGKAGLTVCGERELFGFEAAT
jgi:hypothetical protein